MAIDKIQTKLVAARERAVALISFISIRKPLSLLIILLLTIILVFQLEGNHQVVIRTITKSVGEFIIPSTENKEESKLNLLDDDDPRLSVVPGSECTLEYINRLQLQQNHPCVIQVIQRRFLYVPAEPNVPYQLDKPDIEDPSKGQSQLRKKKFGDQKNGFFIECGALDGEYGSNTLNLERFHNWTGLLIDADQQTFGKLLSRRRKAYALPVCLSSVPYPTEVKFNQFWGAGTIDDPKIVDPIKIKREKGASITVQCFPLYSILLAIRQTSIDLFSLDVEGYEMGILRTIPWSKVDVKTMMIEWHYVGQKNLTDFLGPLGYYVFANNDIQDHRDLLFAKNESNNINS